MCIEPENELLAQCIASGQVSAAQLAQHAAEEKVMSVKEMNQTGEYFLVYIAGENSEPIVTIAHDGTVIIHKEGAAPEAARMFYESLQFQGQTLFQQVESLRIDISNAQLSIDSLNRRLMSQTGKDI